MAKRSRKKQSVPDPASSEPMPRRDPEATLFTIDRMTLLRGLVIVGAAFWIYWPSLHGSWLWDDNRYLADNLLLRTLSGLQKVWLQPNESGEYYPVEETLQWMQWHLWGMDTLGYHLTNVILHVCSSFLLWRLLAKLGLKMAWLGGLIFAIHPLQVESVAWMSELKNTVSLPPFLLAMCAYINYDEKGRRRDYFLALGLFLVAMLCKPTMVMFPVVILLFAWWKRGRINWSDLKASAAFFAISGILGLATLWLQRDHTAGAGVIPVGGFFSRLVLAGLSIPFYFSKFVLPIGLLPIYPYWRLHPLPFLQILSWPLLLGVVIWCWTHKAAWGRHALLGLGFVLINLAPVLVFILGNYPTMTWSLDHLFYLPIIGLIGLVVAALELIESQLHRVVRVGALGFLVGAFLLLAAQSRAYASNYLNPVTLWTYTLQRNPLAWPAYNDLGYALLRAGRLSEGVKSLELALKIKPDYAKAHYNLGVALYQLGQTTEATEQFQVALKIFPGYADAHNNLGYALLHAGQIPDAVEQFEEALKINPDYVDAHDNLGAALQQMGRLADAIEQYEDALKLDPGYAEAYNNLGIALYQAGRMTEAIGQFEQALKIKPDYAEAHYNLGIALYRKGEMAEAMEQFGEALKFKPDYADARNNLMKLQSLQQTQPARN